MLMLVIICLQSPQHHFFRGLPISFRFEMENFRKQNFSYFKPPYLIPILVFLITLNYRYVKGQTNLYTYPVTTNRIAEYHFEVTDGYLQPDNYKQLGYLINGQFPGPPIFCNQFDLIKVTVVNRMTTPCTFHFHGLLQSQTVGSDGVPYVTQDPIMPNQTYIYEIQVGTQTGTYVYHGHFRFDIVFIHGAVIVRDNPSYWDHLGPDYQYNIGCEHYFLLEEIYHYSLEQFYVDVTGIWKGKPPTKSLPINGYSYGKWPDNNGNAPGYEVVTVSPGKTYRFRIINMASDSLLVFRIEGHKMKIIEMDGILCFPAWVDYVVINTGQRYSVLVTMDKNSTNYWIHNEKLSLGGGPDNGRAILHYTGATDPSAWRKQVFTNNSVAYNISNMRLPKLFPNRMLSQTEVYELPRRSNKRIVIDTHMVKVNGSYQFLINGHHFQQPKTTYLTQVRQGIDIGATDSKQVYSIIEGQVVDIIFQNRVMDDGPCLQHPWHLHGHSFWIVAAGPDTYDFLKVENEIDKNVDNGGHLEFRDVFTMYPSQTKVNKTSGAGCGWAVIRFIANNPGIWLAHCHITTHMLIGKQFCVYEYRKDNRRLINE